MEYNKTEQKFEWQNGGVLERDMWSPAERNRTLSYLIAGTLQDYCVAIDLCTGKWVLRLCVAQLLVLCSHELDKTPVEDMVSNLSSK